MSKLTVENDTLDTLLLSASRMLAKCEENSIDDVMCKDAITAIMKELGPHMHSKANIEQKVKMYEDKFACEDFTSLKAGDTVVATIDFNDTDDNRFIRKGTTDTIDSISSDHHGGLQINLKNHGRGWTNHLWHRMDKK